MIRVDYTQLAPRIVLSLAQAGTGYIVWDQACRYYVIAPHSLAFCLRFMRAMAGRGDAVVDEASVERAAWAEAYSVKVPALDGAEATPAWDDGNSAPSNVVAFRREA